MNSRFELIKKAIVIFKEEEGKNTFPDENFLVEFIIHQCKLIKANK